MLMKTHGKRQNFSETANAVHLLVRGFPRVSSAPSGSTKPWRIPQSCATRSQQIAYLGESNCGWRNPWDETSDIGHVFVQEQQFFSLGKFPLRCVDDFRKVAIVLQTCLIQISMIVFEC